MDTHTGNLLGALALAYSDAQLAAVAETGIDPAEAAVLLAVFTRPGSTVGQTAHVAGLTHSGAVRVVDRLSRSGLIERRPASDGRTVALHCTSSGEVAANRALEARRAALDRLAGGLTETEERSFRRVARKLLSSLPRTRYEAWRTCRLCDHRVCRGAACPVGSSVS